MYTQTPMQPGESYNMSELHHPGGYDTYGAGAGAGAAGVGAAGLGRSKSATAPYNAFAAPPQPMPQATYPQDQFGQPHSQDGYTVDPYAQPQVAVGGYYDAPASAVGTPGLRYRQRGASGGNEMDLLDAAGLAGGAAGMAGLVRGTSQSTSQTLNRNKSLGSSQAHSDDPYASGGGMFAPQSDHPAMYTHSPSPPQSQTSHGHYPPQPPAPLNLSVPAPQSGFMPSSATTDGDDPYSGIEHSPMGNPYSPAGKGHLGSNGSSPEDSDADADYIAHGGEGEEDEEEDDGYGHGYGGEGRRVLKVANE